MYRFLLSRQWVILTLVGLALIPVMIRLGLWQLHRHEHRVAQNSLITRSLGAPAVPVDRLTAPGRTVPRDDTWRTVTATGRYDIAHQVVVRQRTSSASQTIGYFVLAPLNLDNGRVVLVNRGWIAAGRDLTRFPKIPVAPSGKVTVTGRLKGDETSANSGIKDKSGLPDRQVMLINSRRQAESLSRPVLGGYIELTSSTPKGKAGQPEPVAPPDHSGIGPHMAYAVQWWLFAAGVPIGWVVLVRRERQERAGQATSLPAGAAPPDDATREAAAESADEISDEAPEPAGVARAAAASD